MIEGQCCSDCLHWVPNPDNDSKPEGKRGGQCRGVTPQVVNIQGTKPQMVMSGKGIAQEVMLPTNEIRSMFPPMLATDVGCYKFQKPVH
jgi:hypothetical protein